MFMSSRKAGALLRLSLATITIALPLTASAQESPPRRPPMREAAVPATLPAQTATTPAAVSAPASTALASAAPIAGTGAKGLRTVSPAEIETATYTGGDLPAGQSALTAKVQVLLDRSGISPGVVDGWRGGMSESAIKAFQRRAGLPMTGRMDFAVWELLHGFASEPLTSAYTITAKDAEGLVDRIPTDYAEKAAMTSQGYTSIIEKLGERFHMDDRFLAKMNPGIDFVPGATISVTMPAKPIRATVTRIIVDKQTRRVAAYDGNGRLVADYPATVGSSDTPSPHGTHVVNAVALNPTYTYNPNRNFKQAGNDRVLVVPPGPNAPVGNVWIDLSEPTYGIHGTPTPSQLFVNQSHGCVRLTNWDAWELAHMVKAKVTTVEFLDPGVSIAEAEAATPAPVATTVMTQTSLRGNRPPMRAATATPVPATAATAPAIAASSVAAAEVTPPGSATTTAGTTVTSPAKAPSAAMPKPAVSAPTISAPTVPLPTIPAPTVSAPETSAPIPAQPAPQSLTEALARAEALADQMIAQENRAADPAAPAPPEPEYPSDAPPGQADDTGVTATTLPAAPKADGQ